MYWISDEQRTRALAMVSTPMPTMREQMARARTMAERRRRVGYASLALLLAIVAAFVR
ncbi:MAG: hypothetical protein AB1762_03035 [Gemmatimonadota bacterium]